MKRTIIILVIIGVVLLVVSLLGPYYILTEGEQAVVVQFGKIVRVDTTAGVKYKVPFVENVVKFSKKVQSWDGDAQRIPTSEKPVHLGGHHGALAHFPTPRSSTSRSGQ